MYLTGKRGDEVSTESCSSSHNSLQEAEGRLFFCACKFIRAEGGREEGRGEGGREGGGEEREGGEE